MRRSLYAVIGVIIAALGCRETTASPSDTAVASLSAASNRDDERRPEIPFAKLRLFLEFNSTANDLGVQLHLDGEPWKRIAAFDPGKRQILEFETNGRLQQLGLTELVFESAEPSPEEVLALFPAGRYKFEGRTVEREKLVGVATLSHFLPPAPVFSPSNGEQVDRGNVVISWNAITTAASYQVIVENGDLGVTLTADLLPPVTSFQVPPTFLKPNTEYAAEVLAVAANGNKTITEGRFVTRP